MAVRIYIYILKSMKTKVFLFFAFALRVSPLLRLFWHSCCGSSGIALHSCCGSSGIALLCLKSRNSGETRSAKAKKRKTLVFIDFNIFIRHRSLQFIYIYIYIYIYIFILPIFLQARQPDFFRELNMLWSMNCSETNFASFSPYLELISVSSNLIRRFYKTRASMCYFVIGYPRLAYTESVDSVFRAL